MFNKSKNMLIPLVLLLTSGCSTDLGLSSNPIDVSGTIHHLEDKKFSAPRIIPDFTRDYVELYNNTSNQPQKGDVGKESAIATAALATALPKLFDFFWNKVKEGEIDETLYIATHLNLKSKMQNKDNDNKVPQYYNFKSKNYEFQFSIDTWGDNKSAVIFKVHNFNFIKPIDYQIIDNNYRNIIIEFTLKNVTHDNQQPQSASIDMGNIALKSKLETLPNDSFYYETPIMKNPFYGHVGTFLGNLEVKVLEKRKGNKVAKLTSDIGQELDDLIIKKVTQSSNNESGLLKNEDININIETNRPPHDQNPQEASEVDNITQ